MRYLRFLALGVIVASTVYTANASAQTSLEGLTSYGFLNQGLGVTVAQPILGLNKDASYDYRAAAIQARFSMSPNDNFVTRAEARPGQCRRRCPVRMRVRSW